MRLALYQPHIPQKTRAALRLAPRFKMPIGIIETFGFPLDDKRLRRSAMDYDGACDLQRHDSWETFLTDLRREPGRRLILLSTASAVTYTDFAFHPADTLLLGRESHGVPQAVHSAADAR